jgi:glyoxylase-like metal-dependent hydrolase (beta-lactamase superfamily II)
MRRNKSGNSRFDPIHRLFPALFGIAALLSAVIGHNAGAALSISRVAIDRPARKSQVPEATTQGRLLAPQAISCVDISADGKFITVGTMAFSHDANVWQFGPDGILIGKRHFPPWAPLQAVTLAGGQAMAVGLAYSRVTSPDPTVWLGRTDDLLGANLTDTFVETDAPDGQFARFRPGSGQWHAGWFASSFGELFAHGPDWVFKPEQLFLDASGQRRQLHYDQKNLLPTSRAMRMTSSADGQYLAFGWLTFSRSSPGLPGRHDAVSVWRVNPNQLVWSAPAAAPEPAALPDPVKDFRDFGRSFRLAPDDFVAGSATTAVAVNPDGSRVAIVEYGIWGWVRTNAAIGKWDPPIHVLNFLPKQRGRLRVFARGGQEIFREWLPADGMFEISFGSVADEIWCWPAAWFARGMAGEAWLPVDSPARTVYRIATRENSAAAFEFPDAVADFSFSATNNEALVSCWDGRIYLLHGQGRIGGKSDIGSAARLAWNPDGTFAVAGTGDGRLLRLTSSGEVDWIKPLPVAAVPLVRPPSEVVPGLPIFQGGRIPQSEHAYVGDIWIIKSSDHRGVIIDAGGLSGYSITQARLRALGIDRVTHVLHTHSHGDHCGGAYLFRAAGAKIVGPKSAALPLTWLMPMLTDYGIYPPRPLDLALKITKVGDEQTVEVSGLKFRALFVPGHSFDLTIYKIELGGKRIAFTGDLGFENQDILHRCWGDTEKAQSLIGVVRDKLLAWRPDIVFTGHGVRTNGTEFIASLLRHTEESLQTNAFARPKP